MTRQSGTAISSTALMVFAHADDETLLAGALIPKLVDGGWRIHLLCVAPGDDADRYTRMELAAADLGVESVGSLRFSPAGTSGETTGAKNTGARTPVVSPPLLSAPEQVVVNLIEAKITALEPSMIVTHSAEGDYGHPDHALCHRLTVTAAASVAPSAAVYALVWPRSMLWLNGIVGRVLRGPSTKNRGAKIPDTSMVDRHEDADSPSTRLSITQVHDVRRFLSVRKRAARHYRNELSKGPLPLRLLEAAPTWLQAPVLGKARLSRVR